VSFGDWLGTKTVATRLRSYRPFKEARKFARSLNLKNSAEWREFTKSGNLPPDIPVAIDAVYKNEGWAGYKDWLPFVDTFRTMCLSPDTEFQRLLEDVRDLHLVA